MLDVLLAEEAYSDVIRKAQELVELALKGLLRQVGIDPPKQHDVGGLLVEFRDRFPQLVAVHADKLASIAKWLRKERELSFYGDIDFIPTAEYSKEDAERAITDARFVVEIAEKAISTINPNIFDVPAFAPGVAVDVTLNKKKKGAIADDFNSPK